MRKAKLKFPSRKEIKRVLAELEHVEGSRMLHPDANLVEKIKFEMCASFIVYRREQDITQKELAEKLKLEPALMSKILHYRFDDFTIDLLVRLMEKLHKNITIKIG
jgi:predicted XRE-type DNA-binding protein